MFPDILLHTLRGLRALNRCVLSWTAKLILLLVIPAAVLLAPFASMTAEAEICGEDVEQCEECIEASERRRLRKRSLSRTIDFARPAKTLARTAGNGCLFQGLHRIQAAQLVPLRC